MLLIAKAKAKEVYSLALSSLSVTEYMTNQFDRDYFYKLFLIDFD